MAKSAASCFFLATRLAIKEGEGEGLIFPYTRNLTTKTHTANKEGTNLNRNAKGTRREGEGRAGISWSDERRPKLNEDEGDYATNLTRKKKIKIRGKPRNASLLNFETCCTAG